MRKLLVVIYFFSFHLLYGQSYTVNFYQSGTSLIGNTIKDSAKTFFSSFEDTDKNSYIAGYYNYDSSSFIKKYNSKGEEIFSRDFHERVFFSKTQLVKNNSNQFIFTGQRFVAASNDVILRVICLDSNLTTLWDKDIPENIGRRYLNCDVKFDAQNNIYLLGELEINQARRSFIAKCNSQGTVLFQKVIAASDPYHVAYLANNAILNINDSTIIVVLRASAVGMGYSPALYKLNKQTGNTIRSSILSATWTEGSYLPFFSKIVNNSMYFLTYGFWGGTGIRVYYFSKLNLNFDSIWTKTGPANDAYFDMDNSSKILISRSTYGTDCLDTNGNFIWSNQNIKGFYKFSDVDYNMFQEYKLSDPMFTKADLNGNILLQSEMPNPLFYYSAYITKLPLNQYRVVGLGSSPFKVYQSEYSESGLLKFSIQSGYNNDKCTDYKYFNNNLYVSYISEVNGNFKSSFITKISTNGSVQWNKNVYNNNKGKASVNGIDCDNTNIFCAAELDDTITNRVNTHFISLDNTANINFDFSFKSFFNTDNSGKIIKTYNGAVYIAGQYKDSLNYTKTFLAKNIGNENIWIKKFNGGTVSDSLVSLSFDTLGNSFVSYNSFSGALSTEFKVLKINSSGNIIYIKTVSNPGGIYLKKSETDSKGYLYLLASTKINGNYDLITQKSDTNSSPLWTDTYNNSLNTDDIGCGLVLDKNNNIIITGNIVKNQNLDALTLKISNNGERVWNKTYSTGNKFRVKDIMSDDLNVYYVYGFVKDAQGLDKQTIIEYDYNGSLRKTLDFNTRDTTVLSFSNNFMKMFVTDGLPNVKKLYCVSNVNRINRGGEIKINFFSVTSITETENIVGNIPQSYSLQQNYPNPFNPSTTINFQIPQNSFVNLKIYDINGRELLVLLNENLQAGAHKITFDGSNLPSGVYYYKLSSVNFSDTKKMVLIK